MSPIMALEGGTTMIDSAVVTEILGLVKNVMTLFAEFPLNVLLICGLAGVAFGLFSRAKSSAM